MANASAKMFVSLLEAKGLNSRFLDDEESVIRVGWTLENTKIAIYFFFDEDNRSVHIEGRECVKIPENKVDDMYIRMTQIVDDVYPKFMKALWA